MRLLFESVFSPSLEDYVPVPIGELRPERGKFIDDDPKANGLGLSFPTAPSADSFCLDLLASRALLIHSAFSGDILESANFSELTGD